MRRCSFVSALDQCSMKAVLTRAGKSSERSAGTPARCDTGYQPVGSEGCLSHVPSKPSSMLYGAILSSDRRPLHGDNLSQRFDRARLWKRGAALRFDRITRHKHSGVLQDDNGAWHEHHTRLRFGRIPLWKRNAIRCLGKTGLPRRNAVLSKRNGVLRYHKTALHKNNGAPQEDNDALRFDRTALPRRKDLQEWPAGSPLPLKSTPAGGRRTSR